MVPTLEKTKRTSDCTRKYHQSGILCGVESAELCASTFDSCA